ncbi:MAG: galactose-1-phosphate uridylyltransferase [Desulfobacterales bacterium]|nr:galactose-1-phosphate uridylyltransferase [Desulfobacterales bacterium]
MTLQFIAKTMRARIIQPGGAAIERPIEMRINPITGRTSRITFSRGLETEPATERLPDPPPDARATDDCPFCPPQLERLTPRLTSAIEAGGRLTRGTSVLFPNLFPYAAYSAVSLFDQQHYVPIGTAAPAAYRDSLLNCGDYLRRVRIHDPEMIYQAITQNHCPSAGGSLLHPHLQVHADRVASNHFRFLERRAAAYFRETGRRLFSDYLARERIDGRRMIGVCGPWQWLAAFAPEGFYELWALLPDVTALGDVPETAWGDLAEGIIRAQKFYRSLNRNAYNLGLLAVANGKSALELRVVMVVRPNHAPWVRSDHTGFEIMLGDMATFNAPEETARGARPFWS